MSSLIHNKILYINNFNILLFDYKQLIKIFDDIEDLIIDTYINGNISNYQKNNYIAILIEIKFKQCKRHVEYFKSFKIKKSQSR